MPRFRFQLTGVCVWSLTLLGCAPQEGDTADELAPAGRNRDTASDIAIDADTDDDTENDAEYDTDNDYL